jgi:elongation factor G
MQTGELAGYPVIDIKAILLDGTYHDVDSSELAFRIAGSKAFKEAMLKASPILMEPVMEVETVTPEESMGDVIGDINSRRGKIHEINTRNKMTSIKSEVPLVNMFGYATDLRSKTQGRATFSMQFKKYEPIPENIANEIIKKVKGAVAV